MKIEEIQKLCKEFGLTYSIIYDTIRYHDYTVASFYRDPVRDYGYVDYFLEFNQSYIRTFKYNIARKETMKRISDIKKIIIHNRQIELNKDFV